MAIVTDIADAVVAVLNAETWSQEFAAERSYAPVWNQVDLETLLVAAVPRTEVSQRESRTVSMHTYTVDLVIAKKLDDVTNAVIDPYVSFAQEIADYFRENHLLTLAGGVKAGCLSVQTEPVVASEILDENRQFLSVVSLTFKVWR
jgi:hypothetical protein